MCASSFVSEFYFNKYQQPVQWNWPAWQDYQTLKKKAEEYDKLTKQADCIKPEFISLEQSVLDYFSNKIQT